jgi:CRP-like cAMP-binding protein
VADELARYGMTERALEALRRADAIAPGHADVKKRFESMARTARARLAAADAIARALDAKTDPVVDLPPAVEPAGLADATPESVPGLDRTLLAFVQALGQVAGKGREGLAAVLFADIRPSLFRRTQDGLHRRLYPAGSIVLNEGDPGDSVFLLARGSVRVLVIGGHGRAFEIRRMDAPDFFGEVAALHGRPRSATVVTVSDCELLEIERGALEHLLEARPAARVILTDVGEDRALSAEEKVVRALPETARPEQADVVLAAHFGGTSWSPRVRLQLAKQMLDAGMRNDALTVIASVAEELSRAGHGEAAIAILKRVEQARHHREGPSKHQSPAVTEAAFRTWLGSVANEAESLPARAAAPPEGKGPDRKRGD